MGSALPAPVRTRRSGSTSATTAPSAAATPPHTPDACYPAAGWSIDPDSRATRELSQGLAANEIQVESAGERRLVQYWYRSHRATGILGEAGQAFDRVVGRLLHGRADGGFVRVSTPIEAGDVAAARERLEPFALSLDALLAQHWPAEREVQHVGSAGGARS